MLQIYTKNRTKILDVVRTLRAHIISVFLFFWSVNFHAQVYLLHQEPLGSNLGVSQSGIAFGDVNSDGDLDFAIAGLGTGGVRLIIFTNDGAPNFLFEQHDEPLGANKGLFDAGVVFGDMDGNGDLDLAVGGGGGPRGLFGVLVFSNDGGGNFNLIQVLPVGPLTSVDIGDIDNDGDLDLVASGNRTFNISTNNGSARFTRIQGPLIGGLGLKSRSDRSISLGDVNADGKLDLVASGADNLIPGGFGFFRLIIFTNDGKGIFSIHQEPMGVKQGLVNGSVDLGDIDLDGDLDLVANGADGNGARLIVFTNDGTGNFTAFQEPMGPSVGFIHSNAVLVKR